MELLKLIYFIFLDLIIDHGNIFSLHIVKFDTFQFFTDHDENRHPVEQFPHFIGNGLK